MEIVTAEEKNVLMGRNGARKASNEVLKEYFVDPANIATLNVPEEIKAALEIVYGPKTGNSKAMPTTEIQRLIEELFPAVGTTVDAVSLFKATKMGPYELRTRLQRIRREYGAGGIVLTYNTAINAYTCQALNDESGPVVRFFK